MPNIDLEYNERCALTEKEERELKRYVEKLGMIYLCTPFSRAAADRCKNGSVCFFKLALESATHYPFNRAYSVFGKPIILSTGMNDLK